MAEKHRADGVGQVAAPTRRLRPRLVLPEPYWRRLQAVQRAVEAQGWTKTALASACGYTRMWTTEVINGTKFSWTALGVLEKRLGIGGDEEWASGGEGELESGGKEEGKMGSGDVVGRGGGEKREGVR